MADRELRHRLALSCRIQDLDEIKATLDEDPTLVNATVHETGPGSALLPRGSPLTILCAGIPSGVEISGKVFQMHASLKK